MCILKERAGYRIAVVTLPIVDVCGYENLRFLLEQLELLAADLYAITGPCCFPDCRVEVREITPWRTENQWGKIFRHLIVDFKISFQILRIARRIDVVMLFIGARSYLLTALLSRILSKKLIAFSFTTAGTIARIKKRTRQERLSSFLAGVLERWVLALAHQIVVQSPSVAAFSCLHKYRFKTAVYGAKHIDFSRFKPRKEFGVRPNAVIYVGVLIELKGVRQLVRAFPRVLTQIPDARLVVCGSGPLHHLLQAEVRTLGIDDRVHLCGWVGSEEVPEYLNNSRLLVLSSQSEGVPAIIQEAMACGTPVAATPVGGIPDLITDRHTGYLIPDGTTEAIAATIVRALMDPKLPEIAATGREFVEAHYSHAALVQQCRDGLEQL